MKTNKNSDNQSQIPNRKSEIKPHILKVWLDFWGVTTPELARATKKIAPPGLTDSFIRHIYGAKGACSRKSALKLSETTGIPPEDIMFSENVTDFKAEKYEPVNIRENVNS